MNIVVVEDNNDLREVLVEALSARGHDVHGLDCAEAMIEHPKAVDLVVLDLNLPGEDGLSLAKRLRHSHPQLGIVMVTARGMPGEKKAGYDHGADIYLVKPVSLEELLGAVGALERRLAPPDVQGRLRLDLLGLRLEGQGGQFVPINPQQLRILNAFVRAQDQRLEHWQIIELLGQDTAQDPKAALELQMVRLRKKLHQVGAASPAIQALRGWGYQLCVPLMLVQP